jgi:hypothetical protein
MNPTELARKIEAVIADYDVETALTAIEIAKLLIWHRIATRFAFDATSATSDCGPRSGS